MDKLHFIFATFMPGFKFYSLFCQIKLPNGILCVIP